MSFQLSRSFLRRRLFELAVHRYHIFDGTWFEAKFRSQLLQALLISLPLKYGCHLLVRNRPWLTHEATHMSISNDSGGIARRRRCTVSAVVKCVAGRPRPGARPARRLTTSTLCYRRHTRQSSPRFFNLGGAMVLIRCSQDVSVELGFSTSIDHS
jgi:hypothetical protein